MKKIQCIIFDYGGVISKKQNKECINRICSILGIPVKHFYSFYLKERKKYDSALIHPGTYWTKIVGLADRQNKSIDIDQLIELDVKSWSDMNEETVAYIQSLYNKIKLAVLSNMTFDALNKIKNSEWLSYFDVKIFSCEERVSKPDERIYKICMRELKLKPEHVLFIDDTEENLVAAQKVGMNVLKFTDCQDVKNIIKDEFILRK